MVDYGRPFGKRETSFALEKNGKTKKTPIKFDRRRIIELAHQQGLSGVPVKPP